MSETQDPSVAKSAVSIQRYSPTSAAVTSQGSDAPVTGSSTTGSNRGSDNRGRPVVGGRQRRRPVVGGRPGGHRAVVVGDGHASILAESLARDPDPGRHLASLVLGPVDQ